MSSVELMRWGLNGCEFLACLAGILNWNSIKRTYWKWFLFYLLVIFCAEMTSKYILYVLGDKESNKNLFIYFVIPLEFLFFYWLFAKYFREKGRNRYSQVSKLVAAFYLTFLAVDLAFLSEIAFWFFSISYTIGNILLLILIILFFSHFVRSEDLVGYYKNAMFWVCAGLLVFYLGSFPFFGLLNTLSARYKSVYFVYWHIMMGLNCMMYILFVISFVWGKQK